MTERGLGVTIAVGLIALLTLMPVAAGAAQQRAEPALLNLGWWWEQAHTEEIDIQGNKVVVGTTNPFCPGPGNGLGAAPGTCAEGRFPVEIVGGDYEQPDKLSGLGFDLSYLTPGSEVISFKLTLLEAEAGCYDEDGDGDINPSEPGGDHCEHTDPVGPVDDRQVQACLLTQIFGDAEAGPYKELPPYECSGTDPVAKRKEVKAVDKDDADGVDHVWRFDLTEFAQRWAEEFSVATNIMLVGKKPKETGSQDSWRVVFAGPKVAKGVRTELVYEPGEIVLPPVPPPPGGTGTGTTFTDTGTGTTDFGSSTTDFGSGDAAAPTDSGAAAPGESPSPAPGEALAADELPGAEPLPGYVWLALLAGVIGFALVRQVVIESATGIRPDGVLAKIHALNAEKRGVGGADESAVAGAWSSIAAVGAKISNLTRKLPFTRKG